MPRAYCFTCGHVKDADDESNNHVTIGVAGDAEAKRGGQTRTKLTFFKKAGGLQAFDLEDLLASDAEVLGRGTFGTTYKVTVEGTVVAVKRVKEVEVEEGELRKKVEAVAAMEHPNVVSLRAYHLGRGEELLLYDYMPMGSLSSMLHGQFP